MRQRSCCLLRFGRCRLGWFFLLAGLLCAPAWAQSVAPLAGQANPGLLTPNPAKARMEEQFRQDTSPASVPMEEVRLDEPSSPALLQTGASVSFQVNHIEVRGATLLSPEDLQAMVAPAENREQTLDALNRLVAAINDAYAKRGYMTSQAYIPPQDLAGGTLVIQVREGRIGHIEVEGGHFYRARALLRNLAQQPGDPLNFRTLEASLNRANRLNEGYRLRAQLRAGESPGETDVTLQAAERMPWQVSPTFDNQGRPFIGLYRHGLEIRNDSLTGWGDRLYLRWIGAGNDHMLDSRQGTQLMMGVYTLPLNRFGTELEASAASSRVNVRLDIPDPPDITGRAYDYGVTLRQPLNRSHTLTAEVGGQYRSILSYFEGDRTEDTEIRSLTAALTFDRFDRWGRTYNRLQSTTAIGMAQGNAKFWKIEDDLTRLVALPKRNLVILRAHAQMTPDPLPAAEQFQIGGAFSVRGYSEGLLSGDRGFTAGIEHRFPVPLLRHVSPWLDERVQLAWFYDIGRVWLDHGNPFYDPKQSDKLNRTLLQSVGVGVRAQLTSYLQGFVDVGMGLNNRDAAEPLSQPTARVHFGIRSNLLPDRYRMRGPLTVSVPPKAPKVTSNPP